MTGLLAPAPHVVPEKKAKKKATGTRKSSRFQVLSDDDSEADSSHKGEEEKKKASPLAGGREEKEGLPNEGGRRVQEGKNSFPGLLCQRQRRRRGLASKGQAPGEIVSIRTPE